MGLLEMKLTPELLTVQNLSNRYGKPARPSPLLGSFAAKNFVGDPPRRVLVDIDTDALAAAAAEQGNQDGRLSIDMLPSFEMAGAPDKIFFDPASTKAAICTCGGLAPGLNNVVQSIVSFLYDRYHVHHIYGVPFGYYGFDHDSESKRFRFGWRRLDPMAVQNIDFEGGSILGSSRGHSDPKTIVDALVLRDINMLFAIGGDGTLAGAHAIYEEVTRRDLPISIVGIPKTIDNDILWVSKSFGFESAVAKATEALRSAQTEARGAFHGIGLVKLMGRNSGMLTATASAAVNDVDFVLVPEIDLLLEGENGFLNVLTRRVVDKGYVTIAVAEGAGQQLFAGTDKALDASGNVKLKDIGRYLKDKINQEFNQNGIEVTLKYIDPSYMLRAQPTSADDSIFCAHLGHQAVNAAMAGKTGVMVGYAHDLFTYVPLKAVSLGKKHLDINGPLWLSILAATGQPPHWG
jgi:6-phosphofructokinase 1